MAAIDLACDSRYAENCCKFMEMIKSRTLTATLSIHRESGAENSNDLERQVDDLTRQLDATEYNGYREGWTDELQNKINSLHLLFPLVV